MKNLKILIVLMTFLTFAAEASLHEGGEMVVGRGRGPSNFGEETPGFCVDQETMNRSTQIAKKLADDFAARQCKSGQADLVGDYLLEAHCRVWNSIFSGTLAQAAYVCRY